MANENDSFIDEVTEDLRRDRLFAAFRRYGWIAGLVILAIVGGAAWREYSRAQATGKAQTYGDAVIAAEEQADPLPALEAVDPLGGEGRRAVNSLMVAGAQSDADQTAEAAATLEAMANEQGANDALMRDLARLKLVLVQGNSMDPAQRDMILSDLAATGAPFELLALEQKAVALIGAGRTEDAVSLIRQIQQKDGLSEGLRLRLSEMMIALGVEPGSGGLAPESGASE